MDQRTRKQLGRAGVALMVTLGLALACAVQPAAAGCPFAHVRAVEVPQWHARSLLQESKKIDVQAVKSLDIGRVKADLKALLTDSQPFWPADNGHYGGLFIRLAWHCNGSYRRFDGRGGCNGARIRFNPELSWMDNTNLDKARRLLEPIKAKYGAALSWGDLIVLAGTTAIESMGGPKLPVCLGRIDDTSGAASLPLGPSKEQEAIAPCKKGNGLCEPPQGRINLQLIYVDPEGVQGIPIPENSVAHIRSTFLQMGMNDTETVALIGGGHAFGKAHGACPSGAGPDPTQQPGNPWPGTCGTGPLKGKGPNTFTSGFEGAWTLTPAKWNNEYFDNLLNFDWEKHKGPGGHWQWRPKHKAGSKEAGGELPKIMMFTTDVALLKDPVYLKLVQYYAANEDALTNDFKNAWYKLMTRSMGPVTRCLGSQTAPAQAFQLPVPAPSGKQPDWAAIRPQLVKLLGSSSSARDQFAALAYQCASTFRATDYAGGCNGARIRFAPQKDWAGNKGLVDPLIAQLSPIKAAHPDASWADLIVLAGTLAVEQATGKATPFSFCPGRTDAKDAEGTDYLAPRAYDAAEVAVRDNADVMGLTPREAVALAARPRSAAYASSLGLSGSWSAGVPPVSNAFFKLLLDLPWEAAKSASGKAEFRAPAAAAAKLLASSSKTAEEAGAKLASGFVYMSPEDMVIKKDPVLAAIAREYAGDNAKFVAAFAAAWTKLMNADRFDGPAGNVCAKAA